MAFVWFFFLFPFFSSVLFPVFRLAQNTHAQAPSDSPLVAQNGGGSDDGTGHEVLRGIGLPRALELFPDAAQQQLYHPTTLIPQQSIIQHHQEQGQYQHQQQPLQQPLWN